MPTFESKGPPIVATDKSTLDLQKNSEEKSFL
jgi:hypothetical protein